MRPACAILRQSREAQYGRQALHIARGALFERHSPLYRPAAEREDCIALTIGEPDLPTPAPICEAAVRALAGGSTHYTANQGSASLRAKIAAYEAKTRQLDYGADEILVTAGATEAIYCALTGVLDPGDEVVIPTPAFGLYETVTRLAGAVPCIWTPPGRAFS